MKSSVANTNRLPPFFSVCVDITNRSESIKKVISGILNQTCQDFELIIADHESSDNSLEIVQNILQQHPEVNTKFIIEKRKRTEIEEWNTPLFKAQGSYIAICEGDDYFSNLHLETAKKYLQVNENIGIYEVLCSGDARTIEDSIKIQKSEKAILQLQSLQWCPVPSAVIFKRIGRFSQPFLYDPKNVYAGEYCLYDQILADGYDVLKNFTSNYVERGYRFYLKTEFHMRDLLGYYQEKKSLLDSKQQTLAENEICEIACLFFCWNLAKFRYNHDLARIVFQFSTSKYSLIQRLAKGIKHVIKAQSDIMLSRLLKILND